MEGVWGVFSNEMGNEAFAYPKGPVVIYTIIGMLNFKGF